MFYNVHKENMFTINLGDGHEAPSKARKKGAKRLEFLVFKYLLKHFRSLETFFLLKKIQKFFNKCKRQEFYGNYSVQRRLGLLSKPERLMSAKQRLIASGGSLPLESP